MGCGVVARAAIELSRKAYRRGRSVILWLGQLVWDIKLDRRCDAITYVSVGLPVEFKMKER